MQLTEEEISHLQRSLDGIPRIPTPPLEPPQGSRAPMTIRPEMEPKYSQSANIQAIGAHMGVTTTAGISMNPQSLTLPYPKLEQTGIHLHPAWED